MFAPVDIGEKLTRLKARSRKTEDELISETHRILRKDLFAKKKILDNLKHYRNSFSVFDEEDLDDSFVFTKTEIKKLSVMYRLKFLNSGYFKPEIPEVVSDKISFLNSKTGKNVTDLLVLAPAEAFNRKRCDSEVLLFAKTNYDNFYLVHRWGKKLRWWRKHFYWPIRNFETLIATVLLATLVITLSLPTWLITLDPRAEYWSGYRTAAFLHLFIFNMGVTAFITFTFTKNFSNSIWNAVSDFD